ncbi:MAG: retropepsin-like aspartic protease, partial [Bacteroidota bacterium]|nr:retropepsin-like aspartic protease [Bacteroidota bacterium]
MRTLFLLITLSCLSLLGNTQTVIKMKKQGGVSVIPCKVNGLSLSFIFDTGAGDVSISMTEASFMLKNNYLSSDDIKGTQQYRDANGNISEGIKILLREVEIAGLKLYNVEASIVNNLRAPLLLGQSAISKLGKIQLDLQSNTLTILDDKSSYDFSPSFTMKAPKIVELGEQFGLTFTLNEEGSYQKISLPELTDFDILMG